MKNFSCRVCGGKNYSNFKLFYACDDCSTLFLDVKKFSPTKKSNKGISVSLEDVVSNSLKPTDMEVAREMGNVLEKLNSEFKMTTPRSPCCDKSTYFTAQGQICTACGRVIQTSLE